MGHLWVRLSFSEWTETEEDGFAPIPLFSQRLNKRPRHHSRVHHQVKFFVFMFIWPLEVELTSRMGHCVPLAAFLTK